jgi:hypothetical protein
MLKRILLINISIEMKATQKNKLLATETPHTTPFFLPPGRPISGPTPPKLHPAMGTRPSPRQAAAAAAGGDGAREARTGLRPTRTRCNTPVARLCRGSLLTTL